MNTVISDASSLILLQKISLLNKLVRKSNFVIPREVFIEAVTKGKKKKSPDSYLIEEKIKDRLIKVKSAKDYSKIKQIVSEFGLGYGEAESIILFLNLKANVLATDDHKTINVCKIYKILFITALACVIKSFNNKIITKVESKEMIKQLSVYGRYKDELIYKALSYIGDER